MKTRRTAGNTRLSRSKQSSVNSDQTCQPPVDIKIERQPSDTADRDKIGIKELSTPKNKIKKPLKSGVTQTPKDDFLCSQHFDSQVVVGWDCQSPDTLRGIKRFSSSEPTDDDLLSRLIEDEPVTDLQKRSTPPLLGVWRENKTQKLSDHEPGLQHRLRRRGHGKRKKDSDVSRDLLKNLTRALDKVSEDGECEDKDEVLDQCDNVYTTSDICPTISIKPSTSDFVIADTTVSSVMIADNNNTDSKSPTVVNNHLTSIQETCEDSWSDDDLFDDDSFIIKATQGVETSNAAKFVSPAFGTKRKSSGDSSSEAPKSKTSRYTFQLEPSSQDLSQKISSDKPISVNSKPNNVQNVSTGACRNDNSHTKNGTINNYQKPPVFRPKATSSTSSNNTYKPPTISNKTINKPSPVSASITHSSQTFNGTSLKSVTPSSYKQSTVINQQSYTHNLSKPSTTFTPRTTTSNTNQSKPGGSIHSYKLVPKTFNPIQDGKSAFRKHNSFSGSDQSSMDSASRRRSVSGGSSVTMPTKPNLTNNQKSSVIQPSCGNTSIISNPKTSSSSFSVSNQYKPYTNQNQQKSLTSVSNTCTTSRLLSPAVNVNKDYSVSKTPTDKPLSGIQGFYKKKLNDSGFDTSLSDELLCQLAEPDDMLDNMIVDTTTVCAKPGTSVVNDNQLSSNKMSDNVPVTTSTPVGNKNALETDKKSANNTVVWGMNSEDLFSDDDYDDDGLTEPEVLAMLDEVELLATQQISSQKKLAPKIPDPEINNHTEVLHQFDKPVQLNGSQESNSQKLYSQADIEKKKQEAIARRKMKMKR